MIAYSKNYKIPEQWRSKPPSVTAIPDGTFIVKCDAAFKNGITGVCIIVETCNKKYAPITCCPKTKGPIHAELTSIHKAPKYE